MRSRLHSLARPANTQRTTRLLQLSSLALLGIGVLGLILGLRLYFISALGAGVCGVLGLSFTWHRALVLFTGFAWVTTAFCAINLALLGTQHPDDVIGWILWLFCSAAALPAAVLSSTMHLLRVWRTGAVTEQTAPLVDPVAPSLPTLPPADEAHAGVRPSNAPQRPIWPPPDAPVGAADVAGAARVASAMNSGDTSGLGVNDMSGALRVGAAASKAWPPSNA